MTTSVLAYAPMTAAGFAIPQFLPQMLKLRTTRDAAGVSWSWAALTTVNNAAWTCYFALFHYWTALVASCSVTPLAGVLTVMLTVRGAAKPRYRVAIGAWAAVIGAVWAVTGRVGLGTLLAAAFVVQVVPSLWTAHRTARPSGISAGTWTLILGELACFLAYGLYERDPRLITLGMTGVVASTLMLARIFSAGRVRRRRARDHGLRTEPATRRRCASGGPRPRADAGQGPRDPGRAEVKVPATCSITVKVPATETDRGEGPRDP